MYRIIGNSIAIENGEANYKTRRVNILENGTKDISGNLVGRWINKSFLDLKCGNIFRYTEFDRKVYDTNLYIAISDIIYDKNIPYIKAELYDQ